MTSRNFMSGLHIKMLLTENIQMIVSFCLTDRIARCLCKFLACCFLLIFVVSSISCNLQRPPYTYIDEENRFTFEYPEHWRLTRQDVDYIRLQRVESGSAETDVRIVACELSNNPDIVRFLEKLLQKSHMCQALPRGEIIVTQKPIATYHKGYESATAKVSLNLTYEFPIGAEGQEIFIQDRVDILAIKKQDLIVVIYVFASSEEYHDEQRDIIESFEFQ